MWTLYISETHMKLLLSLDSTSRLNFHLECKNGFVEAFTMGAGLLYQGKVHKTS